MKLTMLRTDYEVPKKSPRALWRIAYRKLDSEDQVYAPIGLHLLVRAWRYKAFLFFHPLYWLHLWYCDDGQLYWKGRPAWPWSRCWRVRDLKRWENAFADGVREGRRQERVAEEERFEKYVLELHTKNKEQG